MNRLLVLFIFCIAFYGCKQNSTPKPYGYFRIEFPEKKYQLLPDNYPFAFEYPMYGKIVRDSALHAEPYWINIEFKNLNGKIHLSYKPVNNNLPRFIEDAHTLAYKHTLKADAIDEQLIVDQKRKVYGLLYSIEGNAASSVQFYLTDSSKHFLRGALYFENVPNKDSLAPSIVFLKKDILHLISTLNWKR